MATNIDKYKNDLKKLIELGGNLFNAMQHEVFLEEFKKQAKNALKTNEKVATFIKKLPNFGQGYQRYSQSLKLIKQLLPDLLADFVRHYEKPKTRKELTYGNYVLEDYLKGMIVTLGYEKIKIVGPDAAIMQFRQQINILQSLEARFESTLFDIKQLVQADLFDTELQSLSSSSK